MKPELELLEDRITPTAVCEATPTYQAECAYLDNLIPQSAITLRAVQSGNWSNPATWGGRLPTANDVVYIPNGDTVTVDSTNATALAILNNGLLNFATHANTQLTADTIVSGTDTNSPGTPQGEFDMGTAAKPIQAGYKANLVFQRSPNHDTVFADDYDSLAFGLISMGTLNMYGSQVTPYVAATSHLTAGTTTIALASAPTGWNVGDTLLFPGTAPITFTQTQPVDPINQDEQVQIAAVNGNVITLASPLQYDHTPAPGTQFLVADEKRNVTIETPQPPPPSPPPQAPPPTASTTTTATFLKTDTTTEGNWQQVYGSQGYDVIDGISSLPSYAQLSTSGTNNWYWTLKSTDPRALEDGGSSNRISACWYSPTSFTVNLDLTDGQTHQLALYLLDWDGLGGGRSEQVQILDGATGNVLDTEDASNFTNGEYLVWNVSGDIQIRITNLNSNAVLNGLFLGSGAATIAPPPAPSNLADQQAHVMQMHNDGAGIAYVAFDYLGRTDKSEPLANGSAATGPGLNQVGRYALHFHRDSYPGLTDNDPPIQVVGCFETGSPGWGYDNHSSDVDFIDDVAYNNLGAGFATEAGNEIGAFVGDYAIRSYGNGVSVGGGPNSFNNATSMGVDGEGFWIQSPAVTVTNDIATDCRIGFTEWDLGLIEKGLGQAQLYIPWLSNANLYPSYLNHYTPVNSVPLTNFSSDQASYAIFGADIYWSAQSGYPSVGSSTISSFTASDVASGMQVRGSGNLTISDSTFTAVSGEPGFYPGYSPIGIQGIPAYENGMRLLNDDVQGFPIGAFLAADGNGGADYVQGGYYDNIADIDIPQIGNSTYYLNNISFGPATQWRYYLEVTPATPTIPAQVFLDNGQELYWPQQKSSGVPYLTAYSNSAFVTPTQWVGLTAQQLWDTYGIAPFGELAPTTATSESWTNGLVGPAEVEQPVYEIFGATSGKAGSTFTLRYQEFQNGAFTSVYTYPETFTLQLGWNALEVIINGQKTTFFVYSD